MGTFARAIEQSYKLALGDFIIADQFMDSEEEWIFYVFFFASTILSLLVILNIVIAVMSVAFEQVTQEATARRMHQKLTFIL